MDAVGVVCEFDPLHRGHEALLRRAGASGRPVVCAMSGNFTQRGGPACAEKFVRAEMAVRCGADLVAELPTPWAMATAEKFADGGVGLLSLCGVKTLCFGSECGDIDALWTAAEVLLREDIHRAIRAEMDGGLSYAAARQGVLEREAGCGPAQQHPGRGISQGHTPPGPCRRCNYGASGGRRPSRGCLGLPNSGAAGSGTGEGRFRPDATTGGGHPGPGDEKGPGPGGPGPAGDGHACPAAADE